MNSEQFTMRKK